MSVTLSASQPKRLMAIIVSRLKCDSRVDFEAFEDWGQGFMPEFLLGKMMNSDNYPCICLFARIVPLLVFFASSIANKYLEIR